MKKIENKFTVSRETIARLKVYEESLKDWQTKMNLVSSSSLGNAWQRHFEDSVQLLDLLPSGARTLYDFGTGAGFPGMVLAIMAQEQLPELKVTLVESTAKKTLYLKHVAELTGAKVTIINDRIENLKPAKVDVITSRALASLDKLLNYSKPLCRPDTVLIFPKGQSHQAEIAEAKKNWSFDIEIYASRSSNEGAILLITNLKPKQKYSNHGQRTRITNTIKE